MICLSRLTLNTFDNFKDILHHQLLYLLFILYCSHTIPAKSP